MKSNALKKLAQTLIKKHSSLPQGENGLSLLYEALTQVKLAKEYRSGISLDPKAWRMPKDLPEWKKSRRQLSKIAGHLTDASTMLEDEHLLRLLSCADYQQKLTDLIVGIEEFRELIARCTRIDAPPGNRRLPYWYGMAATYLIDFWRNNIGEPKHYFMKSGSARIPGNPFTDFFCDALKEIHPEINVARCETILDSLL